MADASIISISSRPDLITRRAGLRLILGLGLGVSLGLAAAPALADSINPRQAEQFISNAGTQLVALINAGGDSAARRAKLQAIVDKYIDVPGVARFCLGRFWRMATPDQQREYLNVFHTVLMRTVTANLGDYQGISFSVGNASPRPDGAVAVETTLTRPNNAPNTVQWVVSNVDGAMKITDVIVEGTSMKLTKRQEYASYLENNGNDIKALIAAMRAQSNS